jgi:glycosyltransferase involved in cell wall biosynthesis
VVDDCSGDGTHAVLQESVSKLVDRIIYHPVNRGEGAALRSGFAAATGDFILVQDADLEYNPEDYPLLLEPLMSGKADAVLGSRFMGGRPHRVLFFWHMVGNKFLTLLSNMLTNINLTDVETGYKSFKAPLIKSIRIEEDGFGVEPEIIAKLARTGCRIYEVGIYTAAVLMRREKRLIGRTALGRSTRFSNITWSDALPRTSCVARICSAKANQNEGHSTCLRLSGGASLTHKHDPDAGSSLWIFCYSICQPGS